MRDSYSTKWCPVPISGRRDLRRAGQAINRGANHAGIGIARMPYHGAGRENPMLFQTQPAKPGTAPVSFAPMLFMWVHSDDAEPIPRPHNGARRPGC